MLEPLSLGSEQLNKVAFICSRTVTCSNTVTCSSTLGSHPGNSSCSPTRGSLVDGRRTGQPVGIIGPGTWAIVADRRPVIGIRGSPSCCLEALVVNGLAVNGLAVNGLAVNGLAVNGLGGAGMGESAARASAAACGAAEGTAAWAGVAEIGR